jgi:hypothetical protein
MYDRLVLDGFEPTTAGASSPEGKIKVYITMRTAWFSNAVPGAYEDYHCYRQNSDGTWSGKPGETPATNLDYSLNIITNPATCDNGTHNANAGYWFVPIADTTQGGSWTNIY